MEIMPDNAFNIYEEFSQDGFISPNIHIIEIEIKSQIPETISLIRDINSLLTKIVIQSARKADIESAAKTSVIGITSGIRTLGNLQGAIILFERGMVSETKILIRCIYENAFCIGALESNPEKFIKMLETDNHASKLGMAKFKQNRTDRTAINEFKKSFRIYR